MQREIRVNLREEGRSRCPYCLEALAEEPAGHCPGCRTGLHLECLAELGRCPTLACEVPARRFEGAGLAITICGPPRRHATGDGRLAAAIQRAAAAHDQRHRPRPPPLPTGARLLALAVGHLLWRVSPENTAVPLAFGLFIVCTGLLEMLARGGGQHTLLFLLAVGVPALLYGASGGVGMALMRWSRAPRA